MESIEDGMGNLTIWQDLANLKNDKYFPIAHLPSFSSGLLMQNLQIFDLESKTMRPIYIGTQLSIY